MVSIIQWPWYMDTYTYTKFTNRARSPKSILQQLEIEMRGIDSKQSLMIWEEAMGAGLTYQFQRVILSTWAAYFVTRGDHANVVDMSDLSHGSSPYIIYASFFLCQWKMKIHLGPMGTWGKIIKKKLGIIYLISLLPFTHSVSQFIHSEQNL